MIAESQRRATPNFNLQQHLWGLHIENVENFRHNEDLRAKATQFTAAVAFALFTVDKATADGRLSGAIGVFMILLGLFGALFTLKHHERSRFFVRAADAYRKALQDLARESGSQFDNSALFDLAIELHARDPLGFRYKLNRQMDDQSLAAEEQLASVRKMPIPRKKLVERLIANIQVYQLWGLLNLFICVLGVLVVFAR